MFPFQSPFPAMNEWQKWLNHLNEKDVEKYVQNVLSSSLPSSWQTNEKMQDFRKDEDNYSYRSSSSAEAPSLREAVFETHEAVYVKISIPDPSIFDHLKIFHTSNQTILEGLPAPHNKKVIILPAIVKKKGAAANYKDGILQIMLPKEVDFQYTEIDVRHLD
ncbi:Hsp20/alpha crystallin family protein [Pseudobacillus sp. FSL P4-0506]|uniref:Hsp20/alpha crystallin family protein n=1 Tax=unclassified Pseudobacillus TaxID=2619284 RepID=UPI0030F576D4